MKRTAICILLCITSLFCVSCNQGESDGTKNVYTKEYGNSHKPLIVTTPKTNGSYDVFIYDFPNGTLESILHEVHFDNEEDATKLYEQLLASGTEFLSIDGNTVSYKEFESKWFGQEKSSVIDILKETWDILGYTYVSK